MHELSSVSCDENEKKGHSQDNMPFDLKAEDYSSVEKVLRVTAWAMRFIKKTRKLTDEKGSLSAAEILHAKYLWNLHVQRAEFPKLLTNKSNGKNGNIVKQLDIYKDGNGLFRCFGRLQHADISHDAKFPV